MKTYSSRRHNSGFTVIELLVVIAIAGIASVLVFVQQNDLRTSNQDERRKTAINAIYYNLEEVFYPKNGFYPETLSAEKLPAMDPTLLTDTNGIKLGQKIESDADLDPEMRQAAEALAQSAYEYKYEPTNCDAAGKCKSYSLRVQLAKEAEYVKTSRNK